MGTEMMIGWMKEVRDMGVWIYRKLWVEGSGQERKVWIHSHGVQSVYVNGDRYGTIAYSDVTKRKKGNIILQFKE